MYQICFTHDLASVLSIYVLLVCFLPGLSILSWDVYRFVRGMQASFQRKCSCRACCSSQILQTYFLGVVTVVNFDAARVNYHVSPFLKELSVSSHEPFTEHIQFRNKHGITKDVHSQPKHPHFQPGNEWRTDSCSPGYPVQILFPLTKIVLFCYILQPSLAM